jgi:dihydrofolate reductase
VLNHPAVTAAIIGPRTMEQLESQLPAADVVLMAWLADYLGPNPTADQVLAQIGALLIGNRTYQLAKTEEGKPYGGAWAGPMFVLTHDAPEHAAAGFTFVSGDINQAVATAKAAAGDKYVVVFGATTAQECLDAGLLDEVLVHIAPVLLVTVCGCSTDRAAPTSSWSGSA